jgi:hypothetical protein
MLKEKNHYPHINDWKNTISCNIQMNLNPTEFIQASLNQEKGELVNRRQDIVEGLLLRSRVKFHKNSINSLVGVALTRYMPAPFS